MFDNLVKSLKLKERKGPNLLKSLTQYTRQYRHVDFVVP